jgi:DNA-binding winged helix-turn-helix (wHTH) protein
MLEFPPFRLDTVNQCLWRRSDRGDEERILLPPKAFAVLHYLAEHAGRLVTEDELLATVWPKVFVQPEAVKSQVHEIRRVLGDNPKAPTYIETRPRHGYQFIAPIRNGPSSDLAVPSKRAAGRVVGRDRALAELSNALHTASTGQTQIVLVIGEPGIGKSALVDEFLRRAAIEVPGVRIAMGQCIEGYGGKEAYYPMLEALGQLCNGAAAASIVETLATDAPTWLVQFPALVRREHREMLQQEILGATRERMLREIGAALEAISANSVLVVVFEDLQWVDDSTLDLLSALARRRRPAKLILVATYRLADAETADHPFRALKQDLLLHKLCREVDLQPLTEADVAEYLADGSPPDSLPEGFAELIHQHTDGNPLFMVAALDHLTRRGLISCEDGSWQLRVRLDEIDLGVPDSLRQMIEAQIERLSAEEQRALEAGSVAGAVFAANVTAAAMDTDPDQLGDLYDSLTRRYRILRAAGTQHFPDGSASPCYEFAHALYRQVLYRRQPPRRLAMLHRRIGERLEALYSQELTEVGSELAHHFEQASDWPRTIRYRWIAANTAERRHAHREVSALMERALVLASRLPEVHRASSETAILEKLASNYLLSSDTRVLETYELLAERAAHSGLLDVEVRALIEMAFLLSWTNSQRCVEILDQAMARSALQPDPYARAKSRMRCSFLHIWVDAWNDEHAAVCREALSEIRQAGDPVALAPYLIDYSFLLFMCSEYRESCQSALEGLAVLTEGSKGNPCASLPQTNGSTAAYLANLFLGAWGDALREIESTLVTLTKNGSETWAQGLRFWAAYLNIQAMDFAGARVICESAARSVGDALAAPDRRFYLTVVGTAEVALGNHECALEHLSVARREMDRQTVLNDWHTRLLLESALTELWLAKEDIAQARVQAERFLEVTLATSERTFQALAWEVNARIAMAEADHGRAKDCIAKALSTMEGFEVPLAEWQVHATAAVFDVVTRNRDSAERHRAASRATILRIAESLPREHPLRRTFLSASPVASILADVGAS